MGHDIYGYKVQRERVAYLRRSLGARDAHDVYRYLECEAYDAGVSGDGSAAFIEPEDIKDAIERAVADNAAPDIINFLRSLDCDEVVIIHFS